MDNAPHDHKEVINLAEVNEALLKKYKDSAWRTLCTLDDTIKTLIKHLPAETRERKKNDFKKAKRFLIETIIKL